jgi:hypothetical protein
MTTTTHRDWPSQLVLPGQTAAPEGPVDMAMMYVMHHAFRRDLAAFAAAATSTPVRERATWRALAERWELFATALHHHHRGEDAGLWPALLERADEEGRATLEAMEAEHAEIDPVLTACAAGFARLAEQPDEDARAALAVRLVAARESLGRHLRHEETEAITLVQRHLTAQDWHRIEQEHFRGDDIGLRQVLTLVPWVLHQLPAEARRRLFAEPGGRAHHLMWRATRARFERRERLAFRFVA